LGLADNSETGTPTLKSRYTNTLAKPSGLGDEVALYVGREVYD